MILSLSESSCIHRKLDPASFDQSGKAELSSIQEHEFSSNLSLIDSIVRISSRESISRKSRKH